MRKEDKAVLDPFFRAQYYENSHYNFTTVYIWRNPFHMQWAIEDGVLFMKAEWQGKKMLLNPFGLADKMAEAVQKQIEWAKSNDVPFYAYGIEEKMVPVYEAASGIKLTARANRDEADYLYNTQDLIKLSGRKYHSKKNHLNAFWRQYPEAEYLPITEDIVPECKLNMNGWYKELQQETPDDPYIATERESVMEILSDLEYFKLKGAAIRIGKRIVAFTLGEQLNKDTVVVHIEKGAPDIRGAYTVINQSFLEHEWSEFPYVNRQEDMGLEGLRTAKESYRPVRMIQKYIIEPA